MSKKEKKQEGENEPSRDTGETPIYLTTDSTLQTPDEDRRDKAIDPRKDNTIDVSDTDLRESDADKYTGSDRAGTAERKDNSI
jgi:hypothetical protein